ncbi:MAG TPA: pilus assembly protein [Rhizobiales bacterium]|nr:pilus assembly protein [Hyphomicrobiales bacterium]
MMKTGTKNIFRPGRTLLRPFLKSDARTGPARLRKDESGATAVEFALVATPFFALLMALFEVGMIFWTGSLLDNAVADAARLIRTGQAQAGGFSKSKFRTAICAKMFMIDCNKLVIDVRKFPDFNSVTTPSLVKGSNLKPGSFALGTGGEIVLVRVFYKWSLLAPYLTLMNNMGSDSRLLASAQLFRNEPF